MGLCQRAGILIESSFRARSRRKGLWISLDVDSAVLFWGNKNKDVVMRFTTIGRLFSTLAVSLLFVAASYGDSITSIPTPSAWDNQSGSTLVINSIDSTGLITGTYVNRAPGYACQNIPYPVTGWAYGTAITFNTIWQSASASCNSITAWTGFLYQGKISTLWSLTINGSSSTSQIIRGNDTFKQVKKLVEKSLILRK
jgi:hypothetical protein|tara:strand:+ start:392 stop:985 length:594 start_codon:yes stop_codon:yes gene_type:complete